MFNQYQAIKVLIVFTNLFLFSASSYADITIGVFSNKQTHIVGEPAPVVSITANNPDGNSVKDVHIGMISPSNVIYEYPNWNTNLQPWLASFTVPANFQLGNTNIFSPENIPGGLTPGIWRIYFALTEPGTLNITHLQLIDLNVIDPANTPNASIGSRYGTVSMVRLDALNQVIVSSSGGFFQADTEFPNLVSALQGEEPIIDQCVFNQTNTNPSNNIDFALTSLDAGNLTVTANESLNMTKNVNPPNISYGVTPEISFFDSAGDFTFKGSGSNQVGSFNVTVPSTKVITLNVPSGMTFVANPEQDFNLVWVNNNFGAGEVLVSLTGFVANLENPGDSVANTILCRFIDDGQAAIPGPLIAQLQQSLPSNTGFEIPGELPDNLLNQLPNLSNNLTLTVNRANYKYFTTTSPELDIGVATVSSGTSRQGSF